MHTRILQEMMETAGQRRFQPEAQAPSANGGHEGQKMVFGVWRPVGRALEPHEHDALADTYHAASGESARTAREHEHQGMAATDPALAKFHRIHAEKSDKRAKLQMSASQHHERHAAGNKTDHPAFALRSHLSDHGDDGGIDLSHERSAPRGTHTGPVTTASGSAAFDPKNARSQPPTPPQPPKEAPSTAAGDHPAFRNAPRIPPHQYGGAGTPASGSAPAPAAKPAPSAVPDHPAFRGIPRIPKHQYGG